MRTKQLYPGIKNSAKIRVVLNGVHIYTTVAETTGLFGVTTHREAVDHALTQISRDTTIRGYATRLGDVEVQVDL